MKSLIFGQDDRLSSGYSEIMKKISIIDSHTGGEPTRLVLAGGPDLGTGPLSERLACFRRDHDRLRSAVV